MSTGDALFRDGEKKMNKMFFKDYEGAQECFAKAGARYKVDKDLARSGEAYMRAGDCAMKSSDMLSAGQYYSDAAKVLRSVDVKKAGQMLDMAVRMQIDNNRLGAAAQLLKDFADAIDEQGASMEAIPYYQKATQYFEAEDRKAQAQNCKLAMARIYGENDNFKEALGLYERVAYNMVGGPLKFQAQDYFLRAMLCLFAMVTNENRMEMSAQCEESLNNYLEADIYLKNTRESEFLQLILRAVADSDLDVFERGVAMLQDLRKLDDWKTHVLLVVKHNMESLT